LVYFDGKNEMLRTSHSIPVQAVWELSKH
jgi:hypothetical protein